MSVPVGDVPECVKSQRTDGKHSWRFDGDDPYVLCVFCGERRDALSGNVIGGARKQADVPARLRETAAKRQKWADLGTIDGSLCTPGTLRAYARQEARLLDLLADSYEEIRRHTCERAASPSEFPHPCVQGDRCSCATSFALLSRIKEAAR